MYEFRDTAPRQHVFILRAWETRSELPDVPVTWHFSTQDPQTGERRGFASLEGLMDFLAGQTGQPAGRRGRLSLLQLLEAVSSDTYVAGAPVAGAKPSGLLDDRTSE